MICRTPEPTYGPLGGLGQIITDPVRWREQLHALAISIYQAQRRAEAALARGDRVQAAVEVENVRNLRVAFRRTAEQLLAAMEREDPTAMTVVERILVASGTWVDQFLDALPGALTWAPKAVLEGAGQLLGTTVTKLLPWALLGGAMILVLLRQAEKSPTVRAGVRRAFA